MRKSHSMKKVKVTFMVSRELWEEFKRLIPPGERSRTLSGALEQRLHVEKRRKAFEKAVQFSHKLQEKYGVLPSSVDDIREMREELDDAGERVAESVR